MKIAMIFDGLGIGGIERVGVDYANLLLQLGHEVTIINLVPESNEMVSEFPADCSYLIVKYPRWMAPEKYSKLVKMNALGRYIYIRAHTYASARRMCHIRRFAAFGVV